MVNPLAAINQAQYGMGAPRSGVTFMPPMNRAPARRRTTAPISREIARGSSLADRIRANPDAFARYANAPAESGGGVRDSAVHGLGWIIGNPVSKALLKPLEVLDYGRAAVGGSVRQLLDTEAMEELNRAVAKLPGVEYSPIKNPEYDPGWDWGELWEDIKKREGGGTSVIEPAFGEEGTDRGIWTRRALGFGFDVATDPLSFVAGGTRAAAGSEARFGYLNKLLDAQKGAQAELRATTETADAMADMAKAGWRTADEADEARAAAEAAQRRLDDLSKIGRQDAIDVIGRRGVNRATSAQLEAMGIGPHAVRVGGVAIPGRISEATSRGVSRALSPGKELWTQSAGRQARKLVTPKGVLGQKLGPATERILTGRGPMTPEVALRTHAVNQAMRLAQGEFRAPARQFLHQLSEDMKGLSNDERAGLVRQAEEQGVQNSTTKMAGQMIETMRAMGLDPPELKPWMLPNGQMSQYVMPHVLSRDAFRFFNRLKKGDNPLIDFIRRDLGVTDRDLLEEGGFLQRRLFRPNADGSPQKFTIGKGNDIEIVTGSAAELEEKLGGLLRQHGFEGKLYETNPVEAWRRYILSTEKDVARNVALEQATTFGLSGVRHKPKAPTSWDPYGADLKMQPAIGETDPRYIRGETTTPRPADTDVYEMIEDDAATKARNEIITKGGEKNVHAQVLGEYQEAAPAVRQNLATQIENTRMYTEAAYERAKAQSGRKLEKAEGIVTSTRAKVDKLEAEYLELIKETSANEALIAAGKSTIHGIRSQTPKKIKAAVQARLNEIARQLEHERGRLQSLQGGLQNALAKSEQDQVDEGLQRIFDLHQAVSSAERDLDSMRTKAARNLARRITRETEGRGHLITEIEAIEAEDILRRGPQSEAALRAAELQTRKANLTEQANLR